MKHYHNTILLAVLTALACTCRLGAGQTPLDNGWVFRPDPTDQGRQQGWQQLRPKQAQEFEPIAVGGSWESQGYPYDGYAWYLCEFTVPSDARGGQTTLHFAAVDEQADIWVNGGFVDHVSVGWNNAFELDISDYLVFDGANTLAVRILDVARQGGIWKPVTLKVTAAAEDLPAGIERLQSQGVRALSAPVGHPTQARKYLGGGMNLCLSWAYLLNKAQPFDPEPGQDYVARGCIHEKTIQRYYAEARTAREYDLVYMPNLWLHNDTLPFMVGRDYRRCIDVYGRETDLSPCPQSERFWRKLILPQMRIIAEIITEIGCTGGVCLDLEFYAGDYAGGFCYDPLAVQGCYCDECFGGFAASIGVDVDAYPPDARGDFIRSQGLRNDYLLFLERRVAQQVRSVSTDLRRDHPDLLLGMLPGVSGARYDGIENWYTRGAVRGMALNGVPALIFSETEYKTGFCDRTVSQLQWLDRTGVPALFVGGLTLGYFSAQGLGAKAAELVQVTDGYWFYHGTSLTTGNIKIITDRAKQSAHTLRQPAVEYWQAIKQANAWLDREIVLPALAATDGRMLFNPDSCELPAGVAFDGSDITLSSATAPPANPVVNGSFDDPFTSGWNTFDTAPQITSDGSRDSVLLYDFGGRPGNQGYSSCFQTVALQPDTDYQLNADVKHTALGGPRCVGIHICRHNHSRVILNETLPLDAAENVWLGLQGNFTTDATGKVDVVLLANGHSGAIAFDNVSLTPIRNIHLSTHSMGGVGGIIVPDSSPIETEWHLLDPATNIRYFGAMNGTVDLRRLNAIYPECDYVFELNVSAPVDSAAVTIENALLLMGHVQ